MGNCFSVQLSGGDALIQRCWDCIAPRCNNLPQLQSNLQKLSGERDYLRVLRDQVNQKVSNQQGPQRKQLEAVRVWVSKVEDKLAEVDSLIVQGENELKKLCFGGYCSQTCCSSYTLATMIAESLTHVIALKEGGNFEAVVERVVEEPEYISQLEKDLNKLQLATQELKALKDDVKRRVNVEEGPQLKQLEQVKVWDSRLDIIIPEFDALVREGPQEIERVRHGDLSFSSFGERVAKALTDVVAEKQKGLFEAVVGRVPIEAVVERPGEPSVGLETMIDKVWNLLMREDIGVIGIYGMGGIGKTTLLTETNNRFLRSPHSFDFVIWVVASKDLRLNNMQEEIARQVGLLEDPQWKEKQFSEKATIIHGFLQEKKFVMLIDDLWNRVELTDIGVPPPDIQNKSKVVFTTRSEEVCGEMEAQRRIFLSPFPWENAWQLFQEKVGREALDADVDILNVAKDVAKQCAGLPLALVTVGRAMACRKTSQEWEHALQMLKTSAANFRGMGDKIFPNLKFSYDNLADEKEKSCLLYCCLFPEDHLIPKDELIQKWVCESFRDDDNGQIDRFIEGSYIVASLVHACLLEDKGEWVQMHDVIRDMCLWIASEVHKEKESYFVRAGCQLTNAPNMGKWTEVKRISLMQNNIQQLKEIPTNPSLLTLLLGHNRGLNMIGEGFFQYMKALRVLDLSDTGLTVVPAGIAELVSLHYLDISTTQIAKLPWELTMLKRLKFLSFESLRGLNKVPRKMISSFQSLQILRMRACEINVDRLMLAELESLGELKELCIKIKSDVSALSHLLRSRRISSCIRYLEIDHINCTSSSTKEQAEILGGLHKSLGTICFGKLQKVEVGWCKGFLQDLTWLSLAPNLTELKARSVDGLEEIISCRKLGEFETLNVFTKLQVLELHYLPQLKSICLKSLLFPSLNRIHICGSPMLKKLPINSRSAEGRNLIIDGDKEWWDGLEWEDDATLATFASCFRATSVEERVEEFKIKFKMAMRDGRAKYREKKGNVQYHSPNDTNVMPVKE